tara:strand:- start:2870 stop:3859 length:990 start_codon:yes stop_codon:yes gene_type:complete
MILDKLINILNKTYKSLFKLRFIEKLIILFSILVFTLIIFNNFEKQEFSAEGFENSLLSEPNFFEIKKNEEIYDEFYCTYYDSLYLNKSKNLFEIGNILNLDKNTKDKRVLDIGCGTGHHVNLLTKKNIDAIGLDQSKHMIEISKKKYPKSEFIQGNILNNGIFDYNTFSHILCLGRTIYSIKDKETFFENAYSLLVQDGFLIVNLMNKKNYNPFIVSDKNKVLYDPKEYNKSKNIDQMIIKFSDAFEYISKYTKNDDIIDDNIEPYLTIKEKFQNYNTHSVRKNENNLYITDIQNIINIAKSKNFILYKKISMSPVGLNNEFLYIFKK